MSNNRHYEFDPNNHTHIVNLINDLGKWVGRRQNINHKRARCVHCGKGPEAHTDTVDAYRAWDAKSNHIYLAETDERLDNQAMEWAIQALTTHLSGLGYEVVEGKLRCTPLKLAQQTGPIGWATKHPAEASRLLTEEIDRLTHLRHRVEHAITT